MDQALGHLKLQASCRMQGLATSHPWSLNSSVSSVSQPPGERYQRSMLLSSGRRTLLRLRSQRFLPNIAQKYPKMVYNLYNHDLQQLRFTLHIELPLQPVHHLSALHLHFIWSKRFILRPPCAPTTDCPEARQVIGSAASEKEDRLPLPRRS